MKATVSIIACAMLMAAAAKVSAQTGVCNRQCLEGFVDRYLDAVVKDDPQAVPIAPGARFTENGQRLAIGDGLWRSMRSKGHYRLFVADPEAGQVAFMGSIEEDDRDPAKGVPALMALRLKIVRNQITECATPMPGSAWKRSARRTRCSCSRSRRTSACRART